MTMLKNKTFLKEAVLVYTDDECINDVLEEGLLQGTLSIDITEGKARFECDEPIIFEDIDTVTIDDNGEKIEITSDECKWTFSVKK